MKLVYILILFFSLSGCIFPDVYKLDVQQGNIVTQDMLDQLQVGMNQRQVLYIMGTPVLNNPYSKKRWDYLYSLEEDDKVTKYYRVSLYFDESFRYDYYVGRLPAKPEGDKKEELSEDKKQEVKEAEEEIKKVEKEVEEKEQEESEKEIEDKDFSKKPDAQES